MASPFLGSKFRATYANGTPLAGGKVYTYAAGTLSALPTYSTEEGSAGTGNLNTNPVILDSTGRADIFIPPGVAYRFITKTPTGVLAPDGDQDNILFNTAADIEAFPTLIAGATPTDTSAEILSLNTAGSPYRIPSAIAHDFGVLSPGFATVNSTDFATIGTTEKLTNGTFTGNATGWTLGNFTYDTNAITHTAGTAGSATQQITLKAYRHYLLTVRVTTVARGLIDFKFNGATMLDDVGGYTFDSSTRTHYFDFLNPTGTTANFQILTDVAWQGGIEDVSLIEVSAETRITNPAFSSDDLQGRIPHGLKIPRFNAGSYGFGDRMTTALASANAVWNVAIGARALATNIDGYENTAVGSFALKNTTTSRNTAFGYSAGKYNTLGQHLTLIGYKAGAANTIGVRNDAHGMHTLMQNTAGNDNLAVGWQALYNVLNTSNNAAVGSQTGMNCRGTSNVYVGALAGYLDSDVNVVTTHSYGTSVGSESKVFGNHGTALGYAARVGSSVSQVDDAIAIGNAAVNMLPSSAKLGFALNAVGLSGRLHSKQPFAENATGSGVTYTTTDFVASVLMTRSGPAAGFSDTTPTAAAIVAAIPGCEAGMGYQYWIRNTSANLLTMLAGSGVTLSGTTTAAAGQTRQYIVQVTNAGAGTEAVTVLGLGTMAN